MFYLHTKKRIYGVIITFKKKGLNFDTKNLLLLIYFPKVGCRDFIFKDSTKHNTNDIVFYNIFSYKTLQCS